MYYVRLIKLLIVETYYTLFYTFLFTYSNIVYRNAETGHCKKYYAHCIASEVLEGTWSSD